MDALQRLISITSELKSDEDDPRVQEILTVFGQLVDKVHPKIVQSISDLRRAAENTRRSRGDEEGGSGSAARA